MKDYNSDVNIQGKGTPGVRKHMSKLAALVVKQTIDRSPKFGFGINMGKKRLF